MTALTVQLPSVRAAFGTLIDYAGLFPPAELPIARACSEYEAARRAPYAWMLGRFIVPAPLLATLPDGFAAPLSVIVDGEVETFDRLGALRQAGAQIDALEIPLRKSISPDRKNISRDDILDVTGELESNIVVAGLRDLPAFVEIPRFGPWRGLLAETMNALARMQLCAKLRCGGVTAEAFPSVDDVVEFILAAQEARLPFKATAGLHHPVRHTDKTTGFTMHGFLNLIAAVALAQRVERKTLDEIVAEEDPKAFAFDDTSFCWRDRRIGIADLTQTRREAFVGYGSCSFVEPIEDLCALGLLPSR